MIIVPKLELVKNLFTLKYSQKKITESKKIILNRTKILTLNFINIFSTAIGLQSFSSSKLMMCYKGCCSTMVIKCGPEGSHSIVVQGLAMVKNWEGLPLLEMVSHCQIKSFKRRHLPSPYNGVHGIKLIILEFLITITQSYSLVSTSPKALHVKYLLKRLKNIKCTYPLYN